MSIFASRTTATIPIPFDPPHEVTVQKLAGRHLKRAADVFLGELVSGVQQRGGAAVQKDMQTLFERDKQAAEKAVEAVKANPLNGYDPYTLIRFGVKAWTYPESLKPATPFDAKALFEMAKRGEEEKAIDLVLASLANGDGWRVPALDDLSDEAVEFFATEVMKLTKPALFKSKDEQEADQKND